MVLSYIALEEPKGFRKLFNSFSFVKSRNLINLGFYSSHNLKSQNMSPFAASIGVARIFDREGGKPYREGAA